MTDKTENKPAVDAVAPARPQPGGPVKKFTPSKTPTQTSTASGGAKTAYNAQNG